MKNLLFALGAAVVTVLFIWYLCIPMYHAVMGLLPFAATGILAVGTPLLAVGFILGMRWLGRDTRKWGFEGYSPTFLFVTGFFSMFIRSFLVGKSTFDIQMHDTYFVFGGGHVEKGVAFLSGLFAAVYFFYPRLVHRQLNRGLGYLHFLLTVGGITLFFVTLDKMDQLSRRDFGVWRESISFSNHMMWGRWSGFALLFLGAGQVVFLINLGYSAWRGKKSI